MNGSRRGLTDGEIDQIQYHFFRGCSHDIEIVSLFDTLRLQREILKQLFDRYKKQSLRRYAVADPIPNADLDYWKKLVNMDDRED